MLRLEQRLGLQERDCGGGDPKNTCKEIASLEAHMGDHSVVCCTNRGCINRAEEILRAQLTATEKPG